MEPQNNPKILEVAKAVEDANNLLGPDGGPMEAKMPLYRVQELQKEMSPEDFYLGLRSSAINILAKNNPGILGEILRIDPKLAKDNEVRAAVERYLAGAKSKGFESENTADEFFANILNLYN
jgi:hypothetical protein